jgi:hypothetical protein
MSLEVVFQCKYLLQLSTVDDGNRARGSTAAAADRLHFTDDIHALEHTTKHNVLAVEPSGGSSGDEELRTVGVGAGIGHGKDARTVERKRLA